MFSNPFVKRPERSVLVHTKAAIFRIDLFRRGNVFQARRIHLPKSLPEGPGEWIRPLFKSGPAPAREVILLSDSVRLVLSELPETPSAAQLTEILALEAEQLTGIPAEDTAIAHSILPPVDGMPRYLLAQLPWETLLAWRQQVKAAGARLLQVGHPGGLPIKEKETQHEFWPGLQLVVRKDEQGQEFELAEDSESLPGSADASVLVRGDDSGREGTEEEADPLSISLADPGGREQWAAGLARSLRTRDGLLSGIPLVAVPLPPVGREQQVKIGVAAAVLAGLLAFGHSQLIDYQENQLEEELASLREPRQELAELERERTRLRREIRDLEGPAAPREEMNLFARAPYLQQLFAGLEVYNDPEAAILAMETDGGAMLLRGLALTPEAPQNLARLLDDFAEAPWRAELRERRATLQQNNGGPWEFLIVFSDHSQSARR